jgi:hypothetical protein
MNVYVEYNGSMSLVGRADVLDDGRPVFEVQLFSAAAAITDAFVIGSVTHLPSGGGEPVVERGILLAPGQYPDVLPGWQPLDA